MRLFIILMAAALCLASPICSAIDTYHFGDLKSCRYDSITNESGGYSDLFMEWNEKAQDLNRVLGQYESKWGVYYTSSEATDFATIGICRTIYARAGNPIRFECRPESLGDFPLGGGVFNLRSHVDSPTYRCAHGCRKNIPSVIFFTEYEDYSAHELELFQKRLERSCGKRVKKW